MVKSKPQHSNPNVSIVLNWLDKKEIYYEFIEHKDIEGITSENAGDALGVDVRYVLKSLLFKKKNGEYIGVIVPGNKRVSLQKLKGIFNQKVSLASPDEIKMNTTYERGGVPPFIFIMKDIPTIVDTSILESEWVYGSAGSSTTGVKFSPKVFESIGYSLDYISE